jgi:hypothetical protein
VIKRLFIGSNKWIEVKKGRPAGGARQARLGLSGSTFLDALLIGIPCLVDTIAKLIRIVWIVVLRVTVLERGLVLVTTIGNAPGNSRRD